MHCGQSLWAVRGQVSAGSEGLRSLWAVTVGSEGIRSLWAVKGSGHCGQ